MKNLILSLVLLIFSQILFSQEIPIVNGRIAYTGTIELQKSQQEIRKLAKEFVALNYVAKGRPLLVDDADKIFINGSVPVKFRKYVFPFFMNTKEYNEVFTMKLYFADNSLKYEISELYLTRNAGQRISTVNLGYGVTTGTLSAPQLINNRLERYNIPRYRKPFYKLFQTTDNGIRGEIESLERYIKEGR